MHNRKAVTKVLYHVFVILFGFMMVYPVLWMISGSFKGNAEILRGIGGKVLLIADQPACTRDAVRCSCCAAHGRGAVAVCLLFAQQFVVGIAAAGPGRVGTGDIFPVAFGGR